MAAFVAPDQIETERLVLRRPTRNDVLGIFARYASDPEVTRYLAWPRHQTVPDTLMFLDFSDSEWLRDGVGPYLVVARTSGAILGSTGLALETSGVAQTGYVFARDSWGRGYATEALKAMVDLAKGLGLKRLYAECHVDHAPSAHVLEKGGFVLEGRRAKSQVFPNLGPQKQDVLTYAIAL